MLFRQGSEHELFKGFTSYLVDELGRSPRTAQSYIQAVRRAATNVGKPAAKVNADDLRSLLRSGYAPATKRGMVVAYRQFHLWGHVEGLWKLNGLATLKTPKVARNPLPPLRAHDAKRALACCTSPLHYRIAWLGLYAGLRISETAQVSEQTWQGGWLTVMGKGSKKRRVPVHPELAGVRHIILSRQPTYRVLEVTWTRYRDRYDLRTVDRTKATTHTLRRTFATTMYEGGVPWERVARLLGHGEDVTAAYANIPDALLVGDVTVVDYHRGEPVQLTLL